MQSITVSFLLERETKGTYVYTAVSDDSAIRTIYLQKEALGDNEAPAQLNVTLSGGATKKARVRKAA